MKFIILLGRLLFSIVFILASFGHFTQAAINYAGSMGVPYPAFFVPLSGVLALLGGLSILLGFYARVGAWLLVIFLIPVTIMMHHFWSVQDQHQAMLERTMFLKNIALLGGALVIAFFGSGPVSLSKEARLVKNR